MRVFRGLAIAAFTFALIGCDGFSSPVQKFSIPTVEFSSAQKTITNSTGTTEVEVRLSNAFNAEVVVPYTITGTAVAAFGLTGGTVTFAPGETLKTISLTTPNAAGDAGLLTAAIELTAPDVGTLGTTHTHTLTIEDPELSLTMPATSAMVGSNLEFTITQSSASSVDTTVAYTTSVAGETATAGTDFTTTTGTATIPAGSTFVKVMVPTIWDLSTYTARTLKLNLASLANASRPQAALTNANAVGTIRDAALNLNFMTGSMPTGLTFKRGQPGTYFDSAGVMRLAAADVPRFDYDPSTLALRGLLIEDNAGQKLYDTEAFDNSTSWTRDEIAATGPSAAVTPMNLTQATLLTESSNNAEHTLYQARNIFYTNEPAVFSVFVKMPAANARTAVKLQITDPATPATYAHATFNLANGTVQSKAFGGSTNRVDAYIQPINNGWYRIAVSSTLTGGAIGIRCALKLKDSAVNASDSYTGDGTSGLYVWGANLIDSDSFPTSYVPNSVGYRSPDNVSVNGVSSWFNPKTMTAVLRFRANAYDVGDSLHYRRGFDFFSSTSANAFRLYTNPMINSFQFGTLDAMSNGFFSAEAGLYSAINATSNILGVALSSNGAVGISRLNGGSALTLPPGLPELTAIDGLSLLNQMPNGSGEGFSGLGAHLQGFTYRARALPAAQLQTITTP